MQVGPYTVSLHNHGFLRLDGGAMFGAVPKAIWERLCPPDDRNRILMATRSLIVEDGSGRKLIVDLGCGDKFPAKLREIFCIPDGPYAPVPGVTDVLLTHLHFDHCGGISSWREKRELTAGESQAVSGEPRNREVLPNYPRARHHVSAANLENAMDPNPRERASYLKENVDVLSDLDLDVIERRDQELPGWPGLRVHRSDGHTKGLLWLQVGDGDPTVAYASDLCPTSHHLPLAYAMGYDMCAETQMREKEQFLELAVEGGWIVVFEHDPNVPAARLRFDEQGRAQIASIVHL